MERDEKDMRRTCLLQNISRLKKITQINKRSTHLPTELIRVLVIVSMKINQKEAKLSLGVIKCL